LQLLVFGRGDVDEAERVVALLAELDEWVLGVGVLGMAGVLTGVLDIA
jgi:hypothetical protein